MEFSVPANVPIGALVPCPRCSQTLRISSVPTAPVKARPIDGHGGHGHRPPSYSGPKKRLGVPSAPGHVSLRGDQSEVLVNYGLWTLLGGILLTLTPLMPIQAHSWDTFISYQPWAGIIIAVSGVLMMIVYQSGPDFARGPGAPVLVAAFWILGITLSVFSGWIADRMHQREVDASIAAAKAPTMVQQSPPIASNEPKTVVPPTPYQQPVSPAPTTTNVPAPVSVPTQAQTKPADATPAKKVDDPFGIPPPSQLTPDGKEKTPTPGESNRSLAAIKEDLKSRDTRVLLKAIEEVQWYYQKSAREEIEEDLIKLLKHSDEEVLLATLKALKIWGDDATSKAIVPFISHQSSFLRSEAFKLVGKFRDPPLLAAVVERLEDDTVDAKAALLRVGKSATDAVRKGLRSTSRTTRLECVKLIGVYNAKQALAQVRAMADNDKDNEVKGEARRVADQLAKK